MGRAAATTAAPLATQPASAFPATAAEAFEPCVSAWDGNHEGFEALIRGVLNDPGSMETHGTFYNASDNSSDGTILIVTPCAAIRTYRSP